MIYFVLRTTYLVAFSGSWKSQEANITLYILYLVHYSCSTSASTPAPNLESSNHPIIQSPIIIAGYK